MGRSGGEMWATDSYPWAQVESVSHAITSERERKKKREVQSGLLLGTPAPNSLMHPRASFK